MDRDPTQSVARNAKRAHRFGTDPACALCGERDLETLRLASGGPTRRWLMEQHHVVGRAHDASLKIPLCLNCHARVTETLCRGVVPMAPQSNVLDRAITRLKAFTAFLQDVLKATERWWAELEELAGFLDAEYPDWRKRWESRK